MPFVFPLATRRWRVGFFVCLLVLGQRGGVAEDRDSVVESQWIDPEGISGSLVIVGGGPLPEAAMTSFLKLAGGEKAKLVIVPTASTRVDDQSKEELTKRWIDRGVNSATVLHTRDREEANNSEFLAPLKDATGVWFGGGQQSRLAEAYQGTGFETAVKDLLKRGGVVGGTSAGAAIQSRVMIASGTKEPNIKTGLDLLPGAIIDQHFTERNRLPRLRSAVKQHPECVGLGIDEGTALIVGTMAARTSFADRGRTMRVVGKGEVTVVLASSATKPQKEFRVGSNRVLDLTQLRRAARERFNNFPPAIPGTPNVPRGALVIVGGGAMPSDVVRKILDLAGGQDAKIVSLPTAHSPERARRERKPSYFTRAGANHITMLPARGPKALATPESLTALKEADCVWFAGGRQWRFVDAYDGTPALELFRDVLNRGGVICGSSAGASIQGEYLARADALTNRRVIAEGYERGFNFLPGTAIDQHFAQRNRFNDLRHLVDTYPQYLGIGLDEATAIVVRGQIAEVIGRNQVHLFDANLRTKEGLIPQQSLSKGGIYHLGKRLILNPVVAEKPAQPISREE